MYWNGDVISDKLAIEPEPNWRSMYEILDEYNKQCLETIELQRKKIDDLENLILELGERD